MPVDSTKLLEYRKRAFEATLRTYQEYVRSRNEYAAARGELDPLITQTIGEADRLNDEQITPLSNELGELAQRGHRQAIPGKRVELERLKIQFQALTRKQREYRQVLIKLDQQQQTAKRAYQQARGHHEDLVSLSERYLDPVEATKLFKEEQAGMAKLERAV